MKNKIVLLFLSLAFTKSNAQGLQPVQIGAKVPPITFNKILNSNISTGTLAELGKGKLVILDFWSTWCTTCIAQFPKLDSLQKKFGDKLLILPVGMDAIEDGSIAAFVKKRAGTARALRLPTVEISSGDTSLIQLFPYTGLPTEIWIDAEGKLAAITDHQSVTEDNIRNMLEQINSSLPVKKSIVTLKPADEFLLRWKQLGSLFKGGWAMTGYIDTLDTHMTFGRQYDSSVTRLVAINVDLFFLYKFSTYRDSIEGDPSRIITTGAKFKDFIRPEIGARLTGWDYDRYIREARFCYESVLPKDFTVLQARQQMIANIEDYFKISSHLENRIANCLVLKKVGTLQNSTATQSANSEISEDGLDQVLRNVQIGTALLGQLKALLPGQIVIDETNYLDRIDIEIHLDKTFGLIDIRKNLQKYGLDLVEEPRKINLLILQ